ncbi:MAG: OmpA-related protein [Rhodanobacteraceae bacterium]|jgi:outer membrane receptor protein involved in Fe transport|nr:MAG: OmpA-related protein [Rhodanobacteraceae bacterium]
MKRSRKVRTQLLAALIAGTVTATLAVPTIAFAQTANATLQGQAAPGAQITARNTATGQVRTAKANAQGHYILVSLPPGTWQVDAGPGTERTVTLSVASTATLNLAQAQAAPAPSSAQTLSTVQVVGSALLDVRTSQVGNTVSLRQINELPEASRNFLEFADIVPGMIFTRSADGNTSLSSGAQASSNINVYIDGVGQKNYVLAGGITGQFASQGNPFPQLAVDQYKVITSNYTAEFGQLSSAAITAVTKSGTNEFHGDVFGSFTNTVMRAETPAERHAAKKTPSHEKDYGFDIGGPIIKDKAHFYLAYEGKEFNSPTVVVPGVSNYVQYLPANVQALAGPASLPFKENDWFGKLDYEITDEDRLVLTGHYRAETAISGLGGVNAAGAGLNTINNDKRYDLSWEHSADAWFNKLLFTYENAFYAPTPIVLGDGSIYVPDYNKNSTIIQTGASPLAQQNKGQKGPGFSDDLTFNDLHWHGDHELKLGVSYKSVKLIAQDAGDSNALFNYIVSPAGTESIPYQVQFGSPSPGLSPVATSTDKQYGAYVQDNWTVNDHLTFNLGVRWDYEKTPSYLNYVTPANVVAAIYGQDPNAPPGQTYAQTLANGGINIADYIGNGHNRSQPKNEWQPRLGFSYDINGDQKHVIFGGAGRAYDRDLYETLQVEQTKQALSQPTLMFDTPDSPCTVGTGTCFAWNPAYYDIPTLQSLVAGSNLGKEVDMVVNNLKAPYSDQFSLGMRNTIGEWNTSVTLVDVRSYNGLVFQLGNRYPDGTFWRNGCQAWCGPTGVPGFGNLILGNNGLETHLDQLLVSIDKPYTHESHWGASIAYTYSHATKNNDNLDPTDQYAFDYETIGHYPFVAAPGVPRHRLVATATFDGPWGFVMGAKLTLSTPNPDVNLADYGLPATGVDHGAINGAGHEAVGIFPPGNGRFLIGGKIFGYRDLDLQATKNFRIHDGLGAYVRIDLINAFNWNNYVDYLESWGSSGQMNRIPVVYNPTGDISGYPRTLKISMGLKF